MLNLLTLIILLTITGIPTTGNDVDFNGKKYTNSDYYARPYTTVSDFGHPEEFLIPPGNEIRAHTGSFKFLIGSPLYENFDNVKVLKNGSYPIVEWSNDSESPVRYSWKTFAKTAEDLSLVPYRFSYGRHLKESNNNQGEMIEDWAIEKIPNIICYVRVVVENNSDEETKWQLALDYKPAEGDDLLKNLFMRVGHDSRLFVRFDSSGREFKLFNDGRSYGDQQTVLFSTSKPASNDQLPQWSGTLAPNEKIKIDFFIPYINQPSRDAHKLSELNFDTALAKKERYWRSVTNRAIRISIPDQLAQDTFYASLGYLLECCMDNVKGRWIAHASPIRYDEFYLRDGTFILEAIDICGLHQEAEWGLMHFLERQMPDGQFLSQVGQLDANGMVLYALAQHSRITGSKGWALMTIDAVRSSIVWYNNFRFSPSRLDVETDPRLRYLLPPSDMMDNEHLYNAHLVGDNIWTLVGLESAAFLAEMAGSQRDALAWRRQAIDLRRGALKPAIESAALRNEGVIPPSLEGMNALMNPPGVEEGRKSTGLYEDRYGYDWGNLYFLYPGRLFHPRERISTLTLNYFKSLINEGLFPYPENGNRDYLHHYISFDLMMALMLSGDHSTLEEMFYDGILGHTTATHAGCERLNASTRDFQPLENISPHGTFAAKYILFLRRMLVMENEVNETLEFLNFIPSGWCEPDTSAISVDNSPTYFGNVSFAVEFAENNVIFRLKKSDWRNPPRRLILHIPDGMKFSKIEQVNGAGIDEIEISSRAVIMPSTVESLIFNIQRIKE